MSTTTWTLAPSGFLPARDLAARAVSGACGIGVPMRAAAPVGAHDITGVRTPDFRFTGTTLGIPSSRRPSS
jgi:hypothetical protein